MPTPHRLRNLAAGLGRDIGMQAKADLQVLRAIWWRVRPFLSHDRVRRSVIPALCLALGLGQAITLPALPHPADCDSCTAARTAALTAPRSSAPSPPLQGPGVVPPVPLLLPTPSIEDSQRWANAAPWPPPGWRPPPPPRRREERSAGGFFQNLDRTLSQIFR